MKAIILAAGRGSRMKNLTENKPKCLVSVLGKPLVDWQLDAMRSNNINSIGIVTGYRREKLEKLGLHEFFNQSWASTQMFSSLACAHSWLAEDTCIISYSDIFYDSDAIKLLIESDSDVAITYDPNWHHIWSMRFLEPLLDAETFRIDTSSCLTEIGDRPDSVSEVQGQYMGLMRLTPNGWENIRLALGNLSQNEQDKIQLTTVLQRLIQRKLCNIKAIPYLGRWGEVDSKNDIVAYEANQ